MGGYGSGRPALHDVVEDSLRLDLASPAVRKALKPHGSSRGSFHWSSEGHEIGAIGYEWQSAGARLTLKYTCRGEPIIQSIALEQTTPNFGGTRRWFVCPRTGNLVRTLFLPPGKRFWASRVGHDLRYASQRERSDRSMLRLLLGPSHAQRDPALAQAALNARDPFGFREARCWERREKALQARNEVRRIARRQRMAIR